MFKWLFMLRRRRPHGAGVPPHVWAVPWGWHAGPRVAGGPERGWVLGMQGEAARGSAQIRQGLAAPQGGGLQLLSPSFLAVLAEVSGQAEQPEVELQVLVEAVTLIATTEARWWEAEGSRLQGALLPRLGSTYRCAKSYTLNLTTSPQRVGT